MTSIELTDGQRQALQTQQGKPIDMVDPGTQQHYVLIAQEQYERVRSLLEKGTSEAASGAAGVAPGILRSQKAFWRDLPELLKTKKNQGKWVCYHGDERIGIAAGAKPLIRECLRRGLRRDQYDLDIIEARDLPPWEPEEVECLGSWHFEDVPPQA
jgi:hypothetical protein